MYLRPLTVGQILQETVRLYGRDWPLYPAIVATVQVPLGLAAAVALHSMSLDVSMVVDPSVLNEALGGIILLTLMVVLNVLLTISAVYGAVAKAVHERCSGVRPTLASALSFGWGKLLALLWSSLLVSLALTPLALLTVTCVGAIVGLPAMTYLTVKWLFFVQAIIVDDWGPLSSLRYSWRLVAGRFWRSLGIGSLLTGISVGLVAAPTNFLGLLFFVPGLPSSLLLQIFVVANVILTIVATPIQMIGLTLAYYDLRARKASASPA